MKKNKERGGENIDSIKNFLAHNVNNYKGV